MKYWTHNTAIDTNGDFLGRDDAGTATVWAFTEGDKEVTYSSASDTAGTVPSVWTKTREFDAATGNVTYLGNVTANNVSGVNS